MTPAQNAPVGLFDSDVGGLSILHEIHNLLPQESLIYIADSANAPYGNRSTEFIRQRSLQLSRHLQSLGCKVIVVACNTATTIAIRTLREQLKLPFIGVEPAIKPAAEQSLNGKIGVLATHRTTRSQRTRKLIEDHASEANIFLQACPGLVELVEAIAEAETTDHSLLEQHLQPLLESDIDTLVLGCTHYPFLKEHIRSMIGEHIRILDTGRPVAEQIRRVLTAHQLAASRKQPVDVTIYTTQSGRAAQNIITELWSRPAQIQLLEEAAIAPA